jgi:hypothetical protein
LPTTFSFLDTLDSFSLLLCRFRLRLRLTPASFGGAEASGKLAFPAMVAFVVLNSGNDFVLHGKWLAVARTPVIYYTNFRSGIMNQSIRMAENGNTLRWDCNEI